MTDSFSTNFPPQTYSSSYFLNLTEDEKKQHATKRKLKFSKGEPSLLDCFIRTPHEDIDVVDLLKTTQNTKSDSAKTAFKLWKKNQCSNNNNKKGSSHNNSKKLDEEMSMLQFLAINALDLSAPASDVLLKSRNSSWFQLSGHPDSLAPAGPGTVWKKRSGDPSDTERYVYEELSKDPSLRDIAPRYFREVEYKGERFIELQDLLSGFQDPYVIDIKMGTRTFLECEVEKTNARNDLYKKMIAIDPNGPSKEEHQLKAVTKLRYMQFRENQSSTRSHGFRIDAMKCRGSPPVTNLKTIKSPEDIARTMDTFLGGKSEVKRRLLDRLREIRMKIEQSDYFKRHEVIGSSLFMIYDDHKIGAWLIDFAKTNKLDEGKTVDHRTPWKLGNREEGLLYGFDHLINIIENVQCLENKNNGTMSKPLTVSVTS
ncbi:inositol-trisphosphate 3-kinase homolog isoform X1 [Onthophagus taurus]|uniref:inositol-trisphosphate 3-kinase homolog isoform X1 n=1 Tax=Onthophagus taurus TaxID=166361 RepID=UPI0039BDC65A